MARLLATTAVIAWIASWVLFLYVAPSRTKPDPTMNRVHGWENHGAQVYLSDREDLALKATHVTAVVLFVVALIINQRVTRKREPWEHGL